MSSHDLDLKLFEGIEYIITPEARKELARPMGKLLAGSIEENVIRAERYFQDLINAEVGRIFSNNKLKSNQAKDADIGNINKPRVFCVGDVVSDGFINSEFLFSITAAYIVDGKTKRKEYNLPVSEGALKVIDIKNPAGSINGSAVSKLYEVIKERDIEPIGSKNEGDKVKDNSEAERYLVMVEGEEDLLVIPLVLLGDNGDYIVYGQPPITDLNEEIPAGMVLLEINQELKGKIREILSKFKKHKI
ncbi:MAG: DUF359 domain-containing protein [Promethearchaeota archaeon]